MKIRRIILSVAAVLLLCTAVSAANYTDVSDMHWAYQQINYLDTEITGYPDGSYKPEKSVSRAEFLTLFARIAFPDEWKTEEGVDWWKSAYEVCKAHDLLDNITGSRFEAMPRGEIARLLGTFCNGWGGVNERADAASQYVINWKEQRMESTEWQPLFADTKEYETFNSSLRTCTNQGLLTGYPDGSFKPAKGVTRAEAAAILARLKAQIVLRETGAEYVCTVGDYWLMQEGQSGTDALVLYEPYSGKKHQTIRTQLTPEALLSGRLLTGSDGMYVWGQAGLYQRRGSTLEQITDEPVLDFCWSGDNTLYFLSWDAEKPIPSYLYAAIYFPCASKVMKLENPGQNAALSVVAERDENNSMQNLTDIYVENGTVYVVGSYCMGMMDTHAALYEVKDGKLAALFGEY